MIANINIIRGDDFDATFTFDQAVSGFSVIRFTVRENWATTETNNTSAALTKTLLVAGTYTATLSLTSAETLALVLDNYVYDIQITTTSGSKVYTTQRGKLHLLKDVTR